MCRFRPAFVLLLALPAGLLAAGGNRLTYLDENNPYYVSRNFPKLITPQWIGEEGVEAVVVLAIDDMRGHERWEAYLRPILERLKKIDGRAPVSIMTCTIDPKHEHLQKWLKEGVSLETHTIDHPCPLLRDGDLAKAKSTYDRCVDLLGEVPGSKPVAFRVPCCDSLNTPSPRFYAEIFNKRTAKGNFLTIDSSVFNLITANDPELPRDLVLDVDGRERFRKYLPADRTFVNTIEDYPYPYVIGRLCWQFPCVVPSDWSAQHYHKPNNPVTVRDWKAALDAIVIKKGVFCLVFHPHGWIKSEQVIELIDHAVAKHGKKVKFLTFREAQERLDKNLLGGQPLRDPKTGAENGVRLEDSTGDGYLNVIIQRNGSTHVRRWLPDGKGGHYWDSLDLPPLPPEADFLKDYRVRRSIKLGDRGVYVAANEKEQVVFVFAEKQRSWVKAAFALPPGARLPVEGKESGLRFIDLDENGSDDVIFSNEKDYAIYLFSDMEKGWSRKVMAGKAGDKGALPPIARNGTNNGFFSHSRSLWWQNEHTNLLPDLVDRRSFNDLIRDVEPEPKSPEAALRTVRARPGFTVELVAAEPLVQDAVAFAWGPDGKLWVAEMGDYPLGTDGKGKFGGRVRILEDTNGDGKYDKSTIFLDNLGYPTGVMPWRKGVLVTCAPDILYAEDLDGDGKADKRVALYSGFVEGNQQHRVNGLVWGLDNWIYGANGDSGGRVKSLKTGQVVDIRGRDFRIRPDTGEIDVTTGQTQYGRSRDDWGNWFGGNNANPMWHFALEERYLRRNPHLPPPDPRVPVSVAPGAAPVFPISRTLPRFNDLHTANRFTSACSPIVYRDDLFGAAFIDNTFICEPVHNLVHREVMTPRGTTFTSRRALDEERSEFLASSDNWFRPTMARVGPDGALWVADMYRHVIEHPEWIPREWQKRLDLRAGHDRGRIYRVYPVRTKPRAMPRLDRMDTAGLVMALDSPSGWQRDMAQMMLLWQKDEASVPLLRKMARGSDRPQARLHALCTLDGLGTLTTGLLRRALADPHPGVRRHAVRLCEGRLDNAELGADLLKRLDDADPQVRMQLAYTLGEWDDPRAGAALGRLAVQGAGDRYLSAAILSSVHQKNLDQVLVAVFRESKGQAPPALVESLLRLASALKSRTATATLLRTVGAAEAGKYEPWQYQALAALLDSLDQRGSSLVQLAKDGDQEVRAAVQGLSGLFAAARAIATDRKAPREQQLLAIPLLGRGLDQQQEDAARLTGLLVPQAPDDIQAAAVAALGRLRDARVPQWLLRGWPGYGPALRTQVLEVLGRRDEWLRTVLDAVEKKQLPAAEIDAVRRQRLLDHREKSVRDRAAKLFAGAASADRQKLLDEYRSVTTLLGDAGRGQAVFVKVCSACHRLSGTGNEVGPDLAALTDRSHDYLLTAILDPNRAVEARYVNYIAEMKSGLILNGVLAGETATSLTLIGPDGKAEVILRADLEELSSSGKSAMPEGMEKDLPPQGMADLLAYLRTAAPAPKRKVFAGNHPEIVKPAADGSLRLLATSCAIYGSSILFEPQYKNLGYWQSEDDQAVWTVELPRPGRYEVWLDYACQNGAAGRMYLIQSGDSRLTGKVEGTGTWDDYRLVRVGTLLLGAGKQQVVMRPAGKINVAMIDLRSIRLVPVRE